MSNNQRRRGDQLDIAIYTATYQLIQTEPLSKITFSQIAKAAKTSRAVIYRHWDQPVDVLFATIMYFMQQEQANTELATFDQGSLRADLQLIATIFVTVASTGAAKFFRPLFPLATSQQAQQAGKIMLQAAQQANLQLIDHATQNAITRGEISRTPPLTTRLALFDQIRYTQLLTGELPTTTAIQNVIDDLVLPAFLYLGNSM